MSMSLGLHQLNVGMPLTVRDMYKHGEKALYLIKVGVLSAHSLSIFWNSLFYRQLISTFDILEINSHHRFSLLCQPFDILMHVQNIDQSEAGLTVNVEVKPEIRGEVDSVKLARLLTALGQVKFFCPR